LLTAKRDVRRELPLDDFKRRADQSAMRLESLLATSQTSVGSEIQRHESLIRLSDSIAKLPAEYREVIILRHIQGMAFKDIGLQLDKSSAAVRMMWMRAIDKLRQQCDSNSG
jgi:RNA polymerase sigma-70 factor (ECF subfamily)